MLISLAPAVVALGALAWAVLRDRRMDVRQRLTDIENGINQRLERFESDFNQRLGRIETDVKDLSGEVRKLADRVGAVETRLAVVETRVGGVENRLAVVETRVDELRRPWQPAPTPPEPSAESRDRKKEARIDFALDDPGAPVRPTGGP